MGRCHTPFALTSGDEFRPDAPPGELDSALYAQSVNEIESLGSATSTTRTADQTQIAQFWADGKRKPHSRPATGT